MLKKNPSHESSLTQGAAPASAIDALAYWRLCDRMSVVQAALLMVGVDPAGLQEHVVDKVESRPPGYDAAIAALVGAIQAEKLPAQICETDEDSGVICWPGTTIAVEDLQNWLRSRGFKTSFFFPEARQTEPDYLNALHEHYSQKLAAAIEAWKAVSADATLRARKTVKQALLVWLREHAKEFGLTKEDGNPNEQGIEEVAKIANWDTKGGAPKTP
jgi:hypothetical protein